MCMVLCRKYYHNLFKYFRIAQSYFYYKDFGIILFRRFKTVDSEEMYKYV